MTPVLLLTLEMHDLLNSRLWFYLGSLKLGTTGKERILYIISSIQKEHVYTVKFILGDKSCLSETSAPEYDYILGTQGTPSTSVESYGTTPKFSFMPNWVGNVP